MGIDWLLLPDTMAWIMVAAGLVSFVLLLFVLEAPYGRYSTTGWGFMINPKVAWFTQEVGSFAVPVLWLAFFATPEQLARLRGSPAGVALLAAFLAHYVYRDLIYPFRLRSTKPTPFIVWTTAFIFCIFNGYMQTRHLLEFAPPAAPLSPRVWAGLALWAAGWAINLHSDNILLALRKPGDKPGGYKIPRGGAFEYVSAANYFGECIEWSGWALASWSLPAAAFAAFTFANLMPRAVKHHRWYHAKFKAYPKNRKAIIPFLV